MAGKNYKHLNFSVYQYNVVIGTHEPSHLHNTYGCISAVMAEQL